MKVCAKAMRALVVVLAIQSAAIAGGDISEKPKAWIGVTIAKDSDSNREELKGSGFDSGCARIAGVLSGTPAADAGIKSGDFVCAINDQRTVNAEALITLIRGFEVGAVVTVKTFRGKKSNELKLVLAPRPGDGEDYLRKSLMGKSVPAFAVGKWIGAVPPGGGSFKGKVTLLDFWEPWCAPCLITVPWLNQMHAKYAAKGLQVIGLASEPPADLEKAFHAHGMKYFVGFDENAAVKSEYLVMAIPTILIIDRDGKLVEFEIGSGDHTNLERTIARLLN